MPERDAALSGFAVEGRRSHCERTSPTLLSTALSLQVCRSDVSPKSCPCDVREPHRQPLSFASRLVKTCKTSGQVEQHTHQ